MKRYRVTVAYGPYSVGAIVEPTGIWRDRLLTLGYVEPLEEVPPKPTSQPSVPDRAIKRQTLHMRNHGIR